MDQPAISRTPDLHALFSYGFRPFFLGASLYAVIAMAFWLTWLGLHAMNAALTWISISGPPHLWHAHEMVFGFGLAAVAGFMLTAVPNWTGAMPLKGSPLLILFAIWLVGRLAMLASGLLPSPAVAVLDLAFTPALGFHVMRQLMVKPQRHNMIFPALLAALFLADTGYHAAAAGLVSSDPAPPLRAGLLALVLLVVIIGGRIVPSFTHNHLSRTAPGTSMPRRVPQLDRAAILTTLTFSLCAVLPVPDSVTAVFAAAAALANGVRLAGWRGIATRDAPIVWVLHLGYLWIVIGLAVWALALLTGWLSTVSALHALGTGGVGTMILAVMTRASLGHTGRPLVAPPAIPTAYLLVSLSAALRAFGPALAPAYYNAIMLAAAIAWITAFAIFVAIYFPILTEPRRTAGMSPA